MTENHLQNNQNLGKLLRTLNKRSSTSTRSQSSFSKDWPTAVSFSVLNKIQNFSTNSIKARNSYKPKQQQTLKRATRQATLNTLSVVSFNRPLTCESQSRNLKTSEKKSRGSTQKGSLFDFIKKEKLVRLEEEKQYLLSTMLQQAAEIHRIEEDEEGQSKPNAINFKAYRFLNKLLNLKEQIYHTTNSRPNTSGQLLRKTRRNKPLF